MKITIFFGSADIDYDKSIFFVILRHQIPGLSRNQQVVIELWDWDFLSPNDKLGTFSLKIEADSVPFSTDMVQNLRETKKAKYTLDWEVI